MTRTRCYRGGVLTAEGFPLEEIDDHLVHDNALVWVDLCRPTLEELQGVGDRLGLHALAIENATTEHSAPSSTATKTMTSSAPTR